MATSERSDNHIEPTVDVPLGSDAPQSHPASDDFGYAPFSKAIAIAANTTPSPKGLVMAIDGPWGAGKTTLLNFVRHYLADGDESDTSPDGVRPVVVDFNPWWFSDKEQLALQFLNQFQARFPSENKTLMGIGEAMAKYADAIGTAVSVSITSGTGVRIPLLAAMVSFGLGFFNRKAKDVPKLKAEISDALGLAGQRFVVFVDDIDRLTPDEIREVFKVIKAIADFPNVIYILAFDRRLVSEALCASLHIKDGGSYLEKIVQAQFSLPAVSHEQLVRKLLRDLNSLMGDLDAQHFDETYWANVLHDGLAPLIRQPRDLVRIINALSVTYPPLKGEVNVVDFIALEFLRMFVPPAYQTIRENEDKFTGTAEQNGDWRQADRNFHDGWTALLPDIQQKPVKALIQRLFPKLLYVWGNTFHGVDSIRHWNAAARVCSPEMFATYFQFGVPQDTLSQAQLREFISLNDDVERLVRAWTNMMNERWSDGTSRAGSLMARLTDIDDLDERFARACLRALFAVGDAFLNDDRNSQSGFFASPPSAQMYWMVNHLTKRLPDQECAPLFRELAEHAASLCMVCHLVSSIDRMHQPDAENRDSPFQRFDADTVTSLRRLVVERLRTAAEEGGLLDLPDFYFLLRLWREWGDVDEVQAWFVVAIEDDQFLVRILALAVRVSTVHTFGDRLSKTFSSINPRDIETYLTATTDLSVLEQRVREIAKGGSLSADQRECIRLFEQGMELIARGEDPNRLPDRG
ncbi:KAP family P-loop NTPase fold protein [Paraburkholderia nemoris]|uniref:KAP family P-loop NTPase fold protein n=1 Tax=Paraburkholderia nemoris TaxID=2793076 RepID=UPI0038BDDC11